MQKSRMLIWLSAMFLLGFTYPIPDPTIISMLDRFLTGLLMGVLYAVFGAIAAYVLNFIKKDNNITYCINYSNWLLAMLFLVGIALRVLDEPGWIVTIVYFSIVMFTPSSVSGKN